MSGVITIIPAGLTGGTGWSQGVWTNDPAATGSIQGVPGGDIPPGGVCRAGGGGGGYPDAKVNGGLSSVYQATSVLYVNIGPEIHATSTSTLTQDSFESITIPQNTQGLSLTYKTRGGDQACTYTLNSDKSATWSWPVTPLIFVNGLPQDVFFK